MSSEQESQLNIEAQLANDDDGSFANSLLERLQAEEGSLKRLIDSGLPPAEYALANKVMEAVATAAQVVEQARGKR